MSSETTPLLSGSKSNPEAPPPAPPKPSKPRRTVTFDTQVSSNEDLLPPPVQSQHQRPLTSLSSTGAESSTSRTSATDILSPTADSVNVISTINNKLRRRNSQNQGTNAAAPQTIPTPTASKIGPQRTTRVAEKLKILPSPDDHGVEDGEPDEESGRDVYAQFTRIKDPTARSHAARLGRADRSRLPRVTAYCTAGGYRMQEMLRWLKARGKNPKLFDECIYTPYGYPEGSGSPGKRRDGNQGKGDGDGSQAARRYSDSVMEVMNDQERSNLMEFNGNPNGNGGDLEAGNGGSYYRHPTSTASSVYDGGNGEDSPEYSGPSDIDIEVDTPEVFLFSYGTVVVWGMTLRQELRFLKEISRFEVEKLAKDDIQTEDFNFYYTRDYQARIYNDFISLQDKKNYMMKLAISHALAQSVKTSLYEDLVDNTISSTKQIPSQIATTGKVNLTRKEINMQIGELFILRINIHLQGSVLDAPELLWAEPQLDPTYQAVRSYLEMDQRVALLTERLNVIADLLAVLKDQLTHTHGEYLEWIVIILIAAEIVVAGINIIVDLYAGE